MEQIPSEFYDQDYYITGRKGHYGYQKYAPYTHPVYLERNRLLARILQLIFHPKTVLDVGCAMGYLVQAFREIGVKAWGLDKSRWAIDHADRFLKPFLYQGDSSDLSPWDDNGFDLVVSWNTLEHVPLEQLLRTISEICRVSADSVAINIAITDDGHDKSHVSIFPVPWWIQQFRIFNFKLAWQKIHAYEWECKTATMFFVRPNLTQNH
jgi:cyclopropane fatty-acyl-phospholipid synthase-like methyltransferase